MKLALFIHLLAAGIWLCCLLVAFVCDAVARPWSPQSARPLLQDEINKTLLLPALACTFLSGVYMAGYSPYLLERLFVAKLLFAAIAVLATAVSIRFAGRRATAGDEPAVGERKIFHQRELAARRIALPCLLLSLGIGLLFFIG